MRHVLERAGIVAGLSIACGRGSVTNPPDTASVSPPVVSTASPAVSQSPPPPVAPVAAAPSLAATALLGPFVSIGAACAALVDRCRKDGGNVCTCAPQHRPLTGAGAPYLGGDVLTVTDNSHNGQPMMTTKRIVPSLQMQGGWFAAADGLGETSGAGMGQSYRGRLIVEAFRVQAAVVILHARDHVEARSSSDANATWVATNTREKAMVCGIGPSNRPSCTDELSADASDKPALPLTLLPSGEVRTSDDLPDASPRRIAFPP
jgi:hypothetical protein